ncbi:MAG: hypothetical protein JW769_03600 [Parachlamydiales bacterium]|nr:hypothetical protein [Parachlamydiales bacterium]
MNIITFVSTFLLIFAVSTYTFLGKRKNHEEISTYYIGHTNALRKVENHYTSKVFHRLPKLPREKTFAESSHKKTGKRKKRPLVSAKLNIYPLLEEGKENHPHLYEVLAHLLHIHYAKILPKKDMEYELIDHLIAWKKSRGTKDENLYLEKIALAHPTFQPIFYQMLRGSHRAPFVVHYPSLLDLVEIAPHCKPLIYLPHAPHALIEALFNEEIADAVDEAQEKEEGFSPLHSQEFSNLLQEKKFTPSKNFDPMSLITFVMPQYHHSSLIIIEKMDETAHVSVKKMMYF